MVGGEFLDLCDRGRVRAIFDTKLIAGHVLAFVGPFGLKCGQIGKLFQPPNPDRQLNPLIRVGPAYRHRVRRQMMQAVNEHAPIGGRAPHRDTPLLRDPTEDRPRWVRQSYIREIAAQGEPAPTGGRCSLGVPVDRADRVPLRGAAAVAAREASDFADLSRGLATDRVSSCRQPRLAAGCRARRQRRRAPP